MRDVEVTSRDRKLRFHFLSVYSYEMETTIGIKRVEANARNSHDGLQQLVRRKLKVKLELGANQMQLTGLTTFYTTSSLLTIMFYAFYKFFILKYFLMFPFHVNDEDFSRFIVSKKLLHISQQLPVDHFTDLSLTL